MGGSRPSLSLSLSFYRSIALSLSFSLSPSLSLSLSLFLSRSRSLRACDCGSQCGLVPLTFFLAHGANRAGFFRKSRFVGALEFPWLVLCVMFTYFRISVFQTPLNADVCANFQAVMRQKNAGISKMFALGRLNILAHCGLCLPHRKSNGNTARVIENRH